MEKMPFVVLLLLAIITLFAFNPGFRKAGRINSCEISSYQYSQLHAAMNRYPEIADTALRELTGEYVSISQYDDIMHKVDLVKLLRARQMTAQSTRVHAAKAVAGTE
jgi:hypothetical protein